MIGCFVFIIINLSTIICCCTLINVLYFWVFEHCATSAKSGIGSRDNCFISPKAPSCHCSHDHYFLSRFTTPFRKVAVPKYHLPKCLATHIYERGRRNFKFALL